MPTAQWRFLAPMGQNKGRPSYVSRIAFGELLERTALTHASVPIAKPDELGWWDWTVLLLRAAAEVEHALLVQYLYAAFSLSAGPYHGSPPANAGTLVSGWRQTILKIAREEMAHLLTVQNLLHVVGDSPTLERQPFPIDSPLHPFPARLEPLTSGSLSKYIAAEMPASAQASIPDIIAEATAAAGQPVNRVGPLYMTLVDIFQDATRLPDSDLDFTNAATAQADPSDWFADADGLLGGLIDSRNAATSFLRKIGEQGEGPWTMPAGAGSSHYDRFLDVYRAFPNSAAGRPSWTPASPVPTNPTTVQNGAPGSIQDPVSLLWALFANVRYRMLLTAITHSLSLAGPAQGPAVRTAKGMLVDWAFEEMTGRNAAGLGALAGLLTQMPLAGMPTTVSVAGIPFEMPYTTVLPTSESRRWRLHKSLLDVAESLAEALRSSNQDGPVLQEYGVIDADRRTFIAAQ